ncbi:MAG: tRNA (N6-threonylcarbamoyladenosine(37)-N6)-methyltransferase TrmO [Clostridia bacterium]|nr:tRNA (N6-threonylcarbamoyladenosine(37)-N6)-methyltransferase TrmO [Clostridia bacterium]
MKVLSNMNDKYEVRPIGKIQTGFSSKFGIPRQSGIVSELCGKIVFEKQYSGPDWTRGLEGFSHIWVLWMFSDNVGANIGATVRPPKLGGNIRMGVLATRSPFRPNFIGMSVLKLEKIGYTDESGTVLYVKGADMVDGTPIIDIKPYLPLSDKVDNATSGFAADFSGKDTAFLKIELNDECTGIFPEEHMEELKGILSQDPRPAYISDGDREYSFEFYGYNIKFTVSEGTLFVSKISKLT